MKRGKLRIFAFMAALGCLCAACSSGMTFSTDYFSITVDGKGFITSMRNITVPPAREFSPADSPSPLMRLFDSRADVYYDPVGAEYDQDSRKLTFEYPNGSSAFIIIDPKDKYLRLTLESLSPRNGTDDIQWGSYQTNITNLLGEIIGVARDSSEAVNYARYIPDIITHGQLYDSAVSYAYRLGFKSVYANDQPFFKPDRANKGYIDGYDFEKKPFRCWFWIP